MIPNYSSTLAAYDMSDVGKATRQYIASACENILKAIRAFYTTNGNPATERSISCRFKDNDFSESSAFIFYAGVYNTGDQGQSGETTVWIEVVSSDEQRFTGHITPDGQLVVFAPGGKVTTAIEFALFCDVVLEYWNTTPAWPARTITVSK